MPKIISGETATQIKERITECDKFILLATDGAIESKWCNWELGFGDANKGKGVALIPMKKGYGDYKGSEYLDIYPYIAYLNGYEDFTNGYYLRQGYYVVSNNNKRKSFIPFSDWLKS